SAARTTTLHQLQGPRDRLAHSHASLNRDRSQNPCLLTPATTTRPVPLEGEWSFVSSRLVNGPATGFGNVLGVWRLGSNLVASQSLAERRRLKGALIVPYLGQRDDANQPALFVHDQAA